MDTTKKGGIPLHGLRLIGFVIGLGAGLYVNQYSGPDVAWVQWLMFWMVLRLATKGSTVYVNTLLPVGAALAARCRGARVVYHVHEVSVRPAALRHLLCAVAKAGPSRPAVCRQPRALCGADGLLAARL